LLTLPNPLAENESFMLGTNLICNFCIRIDFFKDPIFGPPSDAFGYQDGPQLSGGEAFYYFPPGAVTTNGNYADILGSNATLKVSGVAVGDPHFTTYNGVHYDYQGIGDFLLTRSTIDQFDVQVRTRPFYDGAPVTIMSEAAATLCNHRVTFDIDRASGGGSFVWLDGSPASLSVASADHALGTCEIREPSPEHYKVIWDTGEVLDVTNNGTYLDLSSSLSWIDGLGSIEGLLSSELNPDAWRVTGAASLFDVPEPGTLSLLIIGIGLTGLVIVRRRSPIPATTARC
jgi:hypothetical protein